MSDSTVNPYAPRIFEPVAFEAREAVGKTNAQLDYDRRLGPVWWSAQPPEEIYYTDEQGHRVKGIMPGKTLIDVRDPSRHGRVIVYRRDPLDDVPINIPDTLAHELYHQRQVLSPPFAGQAPSHEDGMLDASQWSWGLPRWQALKSAVGRVRQLYPGALLNEQTSPQETLAAIAGYEGSLPHGYSLSQTLPGYELFHDPSAKEYIYTHLSYPFSGWWEGQGQSDLPAQLPSFRFSSQRTGWGDLQAYLKDMAQAATHYQRYVESSLRDMAHRKEWVEAREASDTARKAHK